MDGVLYICLDVGVGQRGGIEGVCGSWDGGGLVWDDERDYWARLVVIAVRRGGDAICICCRWAWVLTRHHSSRRCEGLGGRVEGGGGEQTTVVYMTAVAVIEGGSGGGRSTLYVTIVRRRIHPSI